MSMFASRTVLRQSARLTGRSARRFESTTAKATEAAKDGAAKATETAKSVQSKAAEGLTRVASAAGPAISNAAQGLSKTLGKIGGRTGKVIAFVERQIPPAIYYSRVGLELGKLIFQGQKMAPPPLATFQSYFQQALKSLRNPSALLSQTAPKAGNATPSNVISQIRNLNASQLAAGGVVLAEVLGFFTIGEMIGRMKLVGYRGDTGAHH